MKNRWAQTISTALVLLGSAAFSSLHAQNPVWNFKHHGEITAGFRFTDVRGYAPRFEEISNFRKGFRVYDLTLRGDPREKAMSFADSYALSATGLGGEPFSTAQFSAGKRGLYDLRATWRQSSYYWNRNDDVVLPITAAAPALSTGLTGNHQWATTRKMGALDFTAHATRNLRFTANVSRSSTDGVARTTRSLDYFNAPSYWQSFARANPYLLDAPLNDRAYRFAGGVDYSWRTWNVHYVTGYQTFSENTNLQVVAAGESSINPVPLSQSERLDSVAWSQTSRRITPISELSFTGNLRRDLEWRGSYIYSHYRGPAALDAAFTGLAPFNSANALAPYTLSETAYASARESAHDVSQGFMWQRLSWMALDLSYRYSRHTSDADTTAQSVFNNGSPSTGTANTVWISGVHDVALTSTLTPVKSLVIRPGVRLTKTDLEMFEDGAVNLPRTRRIKRAQPEIRFGYTPSPKFSVRGSLTNFVSNVSYTPISPHTRTSGRLTVRFQPISNLSIENALMASNASLIESHYRSRIRSNAVTVSYVWNERVAVFGGLTYDSYYAEGDIEYARGTPPSSFLRDQQLHRVWQAGVDVKPIHSFGLRASGNYDRLTGAGIIDGEPPAYGPVRWPLVTATLYYECARVGRISVDLSRTYYIEELVTADNFSANLLTVRFTRTF